MFDARLLYSHVSLHDMTFDGTLSHDVTFDGTLTCHMMCCYDMMLDARPLYLAYCGACEMK